VIAAVKRGSFFDQTIMGTALVGYSMPIFWWGLLLIILFSGMLQWTPVSGRISLIYFFPAADRLHADRQPAVGSKGGLRLRRPPPHPAGHRAGRRFRLP
jgi:ABC-type dipeptide/oligopeptide/nickel transport system permease component